MPFDALCLMCKLEIYAPKSARKVAGAVLYTKDVPICMLQQYTATSHVKFEVSM